MFGAGNQYKGILGVAQKMLAKQEQEQYRASANVGDPFFKPGVERINPAQKTDSPSYGNKSVFSPEQNLYGDFVFGSQEQRQRSLPVRGNVEGPLAMADQNGDGIITQGDVVTAKIEGYKE